MATPHMERRRFARVRIARRASSDTATPTSVQVIDIGVGGVRVAASQRFKVGERGRFTTAFSGIELDVAVEIRSVHKRVDRYQLGARFVAFDGASRAALHKFLAAASGRQSTSGPVAESPYGHDAPVATLPTQSRAVVPSVRKRRP